MTRRNRRTFAAGAAAGVAMALATSVVFGQSDRWYPSRWGADDQRGAANRLTPAKVLEAKNIIKQGTVYQLGHVYESGMPMFGTRHYSLRIPQAFAMPGRNQAVYHDEIISGELGQIGTQFDGLGHLGIGDLFYNGNRRSEFAQAEGLMRLGIENVGPIVTRGVLIDVARFKGVEQLQGGYEITLADLQGALQRERVEIRRRRYGLAPHGLGRVVDERQRALRRERTRYRPRRGTVSRGQRSGRGWIRYLGSRGHAESGQLTERSGASITDCPQRHLPPREPHHRRACARFGVRVRVHVRAAALEGSDRLPRKSDRRSLTGSASSASSAAKSRDAWADFAGTSLAASRLHQPWNH